MSASENTDGGIGRAELALIQGDLSKLTEAERLSYYRTVCTSVGLNPATKPLGYIAFQGKLVLYATRNCTDQLRQLHGVTLVSHEIREAEGVLFATVSMRDRSGRTDTDIGAVPIKGVTGEPLANAYMRCLTKAKRRCTLSLCGLSMLDETEMDTISGARIVDEPAPQAPQALQAKALVQPKSDEPVEKKLVANAQRRDHLLSEFTMLFNSAKNFGRLPADWQQYIRSAFGVTTLRESSVDQLGHLIDWVAPYAREDEEPFTEPDRE